jgi:hypothetical protein
MSKHYLTAIVIMTQYVGMLASNSTQIYGSPAAYPRALLVNGTQAMATVELPLPDELRIVMISRTGVINQQWQPIGLVATANLSLEQSPDLANGFPLQLRDGSLLCAYRHHNGTGTQRIYRIQLARSLDFGVTWDLVTTIVSGPTGVWEPFLYQPMLPNGTFVLRVAYSAEITNGGEQDIVQQESYDNGATWSPVISRIHTVGSRNGMPGIALLPDGSLLAVFEG